MGPAGRELDIATLAQPIEPGITVGLHDALEPGQVGCGTLGLAIGTVEIDRGRWIGAVPGPVVASVDPEPAGLGAAAAGIEHRNRGVVGEQLLRGKDVLGESGLKRLEPPAGAADPVRERRAVQLDALPGEDLALTIQRQWIAVFRDQGMGEKAGSGHAFGDRPLRSMRLVNGSASPAAVAGSADADDTKPCWHVIECLADGFADPM